MHVLHINCNYIYSSLHRVMIEHLSRCNVTSEVFVPTYFHNQQKFDNTNKVQVCECFRESDRLLFFLKQKKIGMAVRAKYDINVFDCIHAYTLFTDGNVAYKLKKEYGIPYVVAVRNTDVNDFFAHRPYLKWRGIQILQEASEIFFLSRAYEKHVIENIVPKRLQNQIRCKSRIIPNGIDDFWIENRFERRDYNETQERFRNKQLKIIYAGEVNKNKNIGLTIQSCNKFRDAGWDISFQVVGRITDPNEFERLKREGSFEYIEPKSKELLINLYRQSDIFVMPSHKESFGLVYPEAMSQGLPVIYTRGQGFDGQFGEGEVGFSTDSTNSEELYNHILEILDNYDDISRRCIALVQQFRWDTIVSLYSEIYQNVVSRVR